MKHLIWCVTDYGHPMKAKILGQCGRSNMLRPYLKVSKSRKKKLASWILPKNECRGNFMYWKLPQRSFFGRIWGAIICLWDLLTFINHWLGFDFRHALKAIFSPGVRSPCGTLWLMIKHRIYKLHFLVHFLPKIMWRKRQRVNVTPPPRHHILI